MARRPPGFLATSGDEEEIPVIRVAENARYTRSRIGLVHATHEPAAEAVSSSLTGPIASSVSGTRYIGLPTHLSNIGMPINTPLRSGVA